MTTSSSSKPTSLDIGRHNTLENVTNIHSIDSDGSCLMKRTLEVQKQNKEISWISPFLDESVKFFKNSCFDDQRGDKLHLSRTSPILTSEEKGISEVGYSSSEGTQRFRRERAETMPVDTLGGYESSYSVSLKAKDFKMTMESSVVPSIANSRFRSGSLTLYDRNMYTSGFDPFVFSLDWKQILDCQNKISNTSSISSKDEEGQGPIKTLDYLGLADSSTPIVMSESFKSCDSVSEKQNNKICMSNINSLKNDSNRIRSCSVSGSKIYEKGYDSSLDVNQENLPSKSIDYSDSYDTLYQNHSDLYLRPRARTTGVINFSLNHMDNQGLNSQPYVHESPISDNNIPNNIASSSYDNINESEYGYIMSFPTRSLWIINLPLTASNSSLTALFSQFGMVESIWILADKKYGFVNYNTLESAIQAKNSLDGKELFPGNDLIRVEYIKTLKNPMNMQISNTYPYRPKISEYKSECFFSPVFSRPGDLKSLVTEIAMNYAATQEEADKIWGDIQNIGKVRDYAFEIPPVPEPSLNRQFHGSRLKEIRKKFDNSGYTQKEIEDMANDMIDEVSELSSDYLGNTIIQKLFEHCSEEMKEKLLKRIAPHLSGLGIHKNGTWAAQKIIDLAKTETQINDIITHISPYIPLLFLDQFGNYVVQCCLKFEAPMNNFIIEIMADRCWDISQGRFGARAMRACLESNYVTKEQQRYLAVIITLESHRLATNPNGLILLTWLLDSSAFPNRYKMLALQFVHHIVYLCTHKLASSIILRIINQKMDSDARKILLNTLFFSQNGQILDEVLSEEHYGVDTIFRIFTVAYLEDDLRENISIALKKAFSQLKIVPGQQYKTLMDEIGLNHNSLNLVSKNPDLSKIYHSKKDKKYDSSMPYSEFKNIQLHGSASLFPRPFFSDYYKSLNTANNNLYPLHYHTISQQKMNLQHYDMSYIQQSEIPHHSFSYINSFYNEQYIPNGYSCSLPLSLFNFNSHRNQ
ncbi:hypothetical protein PNEG_01770 [Pneumocystis murina B123]|uniref:PUM-HD domain-containing protein n=1 Tax=Pneumocystis murina (strain B123) TaxID=1069680 RepID=M7P813_PNEMU|nr:hypothetical protein PNEG_01770 [Pneumocystis murina B123]EMR10015.1 hypothetical protein PNEG_01770 [Pneumocystis murina B123]